MLRSFSHPTFLWCQVQFAHLASYLNVNCFPSLSNVPEDSNSPRDLDLVIRRSSSTSRQQELAYSTVHVEHLWKCNSDKNIKLYAYSSAHCEQKSGKNISGEMALYLNFRNLITKSGYLTLYLLTWRIWWGPNKASRWQMGFNSAFKGVKCKNICAYIFVTINYKSLCSWIRPS